jgi:nucleotide-binding universal stress UspA family protein
LPSAERCSGAPATAFGGVGVFELDGAVGDAIIQQLPAFLLTQGGRNRPNKRRVCMFTHILCPTDLKERTLVALEKAVQIAHQFNSRITMLNVHEEFMNEEEREMLRVSFETLKDKYVQVALESREKMRAAIRRLHAEDIQVDYLLREGKPAKAIVKAAKKLNVDLIVMATDGRDNLKDFVTGTITEYVINHTPCPVLVILHKG